MLAPFLQAMRAVDWASLPPAAFQDAMDALDRCLSSCTVRTTPPVSLVTPAVETTQGWASDEPVPNGVGTAGVVSAPLELNGTVGARDAAARSARKRSRWKGAAQVPNGAASPQPAAAAEHALTIIEDAAGPASIPGQQNGVAAPDTSAVAKKRDRSRWHRAVPSPAAAPAEPGPSPPAEPTGKPDSTQALSQADPSSSVPAADFADPAAGGPPLAQAPAERTPVAKKRARSRWGSSAKQTDDGGAGGGR